MGFAREKRHFPHKPQDLAIPSMPRDPGRAVQRMQDPSIPLRSAQDDNGGNSDDGAKTAAPIGAAGKGTVFGFCRDFSEINKPCPLLWWPAPP